MGVGRSGTTLLLAMLDAHPDLAVAHEASFIASLGERQDRYLSKDGFDAERFLGDLWRVRRFRALALPEAAVRRAVLDAAPASFADATRAVFSCYAAQRGKSRYGDKTPGYVIRMDTVANLLPEARFIHIVRDGRDCALAFADRGFGAQSVADAALTWRSRINRGRRAGARLGPERYLEIRYEDLVEEPERWMRVVADFIELPFDDRMLRHHEQARPVAATVEKPGIFDNVARPVTKGLRDWRVTMPPADAALFDALAGDTLAALGYERASTPMSLSLRIRAAGARMARQCRRALYFVEARVPLPGDKSRRRRARRAEA